MRVNSWHAQFAYLSTSKRKRKAMYVYMDRMSECLAKDTMTKDSRFLRVFSPKKTYITDGQKCKTAV